ncbi:hypothetical protein JKF63_05461 [Porcisia hertigi]|uniref:Uncharacterized protein n=1 Tax=Porcisia hertigi TaxID=2761500 RepID=A0A836LGL1_9TRYP|nr:hypothetical protein JKF63_05461 [Porcisia hertigi]
MLAWLLKEVESPYGDVATLHWAVPDTDADALNPAALQVKLESAEDQLGSVLWNSNSASLRYLHKHILALLPPPPPPPSSSVSSEAQSPLTTPLAGKNVVELGAGVGCLGIALAMAGARVAITDLKELLPLMEHNVRLNENRVQVRSRGVGHCVALHWKWGPTVSTMVHKQLQKKNLAVAKNTEKQQHPPPGHVTSSTSSTLHSSVDRVVSSMVTSLLAPSASLLGCEEALLSATGGESPSTAAVATATSQRMPFHYVVLCDALYGNPKDWPALLYTLTEIMATNPDECEVVNFCEQRVNEVEGDFLKLLDAENAKTFVPMAHRQRDGDPMWTSLVDYATQCDQSASTPAADQHKLREDAANALLSYVLVQRRGPYRWTYTTKVLQDEQSELNMVIRATHVRWTRAAVAKEEKPKQCLSGGVSYHAKKSRPSSGVSEMPRRRRPRRDGDW